LRNVEKNLKLRGIDGIAMGGRLSKRGKKNRQQLKVRIKQIKEEAKAIIDEMNAHVKHTTVTIYITNTENKKKIPQNIAYFRNSVLNFLLKHRMERAINSLRVRIGKRAVITFSLPSPLILDDSKISELKKIFQNLGNVKIKMSFWM